MNQSRQSNQEWYQSVLDSDLDPVIKNRLFQKRLTLSGELPNQVSGKLQETFPYQDELNSL